MATTTTNFTIISIKNDIIGITSTQQYPFRYLEEIDFGNNLKGVVLRADSQRANVALVNGKIGDLKIGGVAVPTGHEFQIPIHNDEFGLIISPAGYLLKPINDHRSSQRQPVSTLVDWFEVAPNISKRVALSEPLVTGTAAIDGILPIGLGQKELIVGDATTGKTSIAMTMMLSQATSDVYNIYVAIGKKREEVIEIAQTLVQGQIDHKTLIISAPSDDNAASKFLAPYVGAAIAKHYQKQAKNVLLILDDLSNHADAHRQLSLLNGAAPAREAYPGDIFYVHSKLLEQCGRFSAEYGGGSITIIPIVQTQEGDISDYISTNIISITDGQIYTSKTIFNEGRRPAIEIGISVSRLGSQVQTPAMVKATGGIKNLISNYETLQKRNAFINKDLSAYDLNTRTKGIVFQAIVDQDEYQSVSPEVSALLFFLLKNNYLDPFAIDNSNQAIDFATVRNQIGLIKEVLNNFLTKDLLGTKMAKLIKNRSLEDQLVQRYLTTIILPMIKFYILDSDYSRVMRHNQHFQNTYQTIRNDGRVLTAFKLQNQIKGVVYGNND